MRKPVFGALQPQKVVRGLKFRIKKIEQLCYLCSENKVADLCLCYSSMQKAGFFMSQLKFSLFRVISRQTPAIDVPCVTPQLEIFPVYIQ